MPLDKFDLKSLWTASAAVIVISFSIIFKQIKVERKQSSFDEMGALDKIVKAGSLNDLALWFSKHVKFKFKTDSISLENAKCLTNRALD